MDTIRVVVRLRPEPSQHAADSCLQVNPADGKVRLVQTATHNDPTYKEFSFDRVFGPSASQEELFSSVKDLAHSAIKGINATVFAYGCTGSGKTHTMFGHGNTQLAELRPPGVGDGLVRRFVQLVFDLVEAQVSSHPDCLCAVYLSFVELHNNRFADLLARRQPAGGMPRISIHEHPQKGVYLSGSDGLATAVASAGAALRLVDTGLARRTLRRTELNDHSSRSHTVITLRVESRRGGAEAKAHVSKFHLVDLAGSERVSLSRVADDALVETKNINLSLASLGNVLSAVSQRCELRAKGRRTGERVLRAPADRGPVIPYRDSKLTFFLKDSLGGTAKTVMIATLRAPRMFYQQTHMTLLYAARARKIENHTHVHVDARGDSSIQILYNSIEALKGKLQQREGEISRLRAIGSAGAESLNDDEIEQLRLKYQTEQKRLEEQLSTVIHNQADQLSTMRSKSKYLERRVERHQEIIRVQKQQIITLQQSLSEKAFGAGGFAASSAGENSFATANVGSQLGVDSRNGISLLPKGNSNNRHEEDVRGVSALLMQTLRDDLQQRTRRCWALQEELDERTLEVNSLQQDLRRYERKGLLQGFPEQSSEPCNKCADLESEVKSLKLERENLQGLLLRAEQVILQLSEKRKKK